MISWNPKTSSNGLIVGIYNEIGDKEIGEYEIIRDSTGTKNVIKIKNVKTGEERLIPKDRTFILEDKRRPAVDKKQEKKAEPEKKAKKKKKPLAKFDLSTLNNAGVLFKSKAKKTMEAGGQKISIEMFCLVSADATKWKHFNLYNHSLGKKGKAPELTDEDTVKVELAGNIDNISKYLEKKGYVKTQVTTPTATA